jgi:hypothetical protein
MTAAYERSAAPPKEGSLGTDRALRVRQRLLAGAVVSGALRLTGARKSLDGLLHRLAFSERGFSGGNRTGRRLTSKAEPDHRKPLARYSAT